jgi:hypothetical protein
MKRIFVIVPLFILACRFSTLPQYGPQDIGEKPSVVTNGGFEVGMPDETAMPPSWFLYDQPQDAIVWQESGGNFNPRCVQVHATAKAVDIVSDAFPVSTHNVYLVRAFMRSAAEHPRPITLQFWGFDITGKIINRYSEKILPSDEWNDLTMTVGFLKPDAMFGRVIITVPADDAEYWLDDINCYNVYEFKK